MDSSRYETRLPGQRSEVVEAGGTTSIRPHPKTTAEELDRWLVAVKRSWASRMKDHAFDPCAAMLSTFASTHDTLLEAAGEQRRGSDEGVI